VRARQSDKYGAEIHHTTSTVLAVLCTGGPSVSHDQAGAVFFRVHTDPGKVWKVLEFNVEIFKDLISLENDYRYGKVWKNP